MPRRLSGQLDGRVQEVAAGQTNGMTLLAVVGQGYCAPSLEACGRKGRGLPRTNEATPDDHDVDNADPKSLTV